MSNWHPAICIVVCVFFSMLAFAVGRETGWQQRHRNEVVCETLLDGSINCIPSKRVKAKGGADEQR